jgi:hypothetical protein
MEYNRILAYAWQIVWRNKLLWLLGLLAELPGIGGVVYDIGRRVFGPSILCCVPLLLRIGLFALPIIVVSALIGGVNQIDREGHANLHDSWQVGVSKFWTILGIFGLLAIPVLLLGLGGLAMVGIPPEFVNIGSKPYLLAYLALVAFVILLLSYISVLAERAVVLEGCSSTQAIKRGWRILKANVVQVVSLSLILFVITSVLLVAILIPLIALFVPVNNLAELVVQPEVVPISLYPRGIALLNIVWIPVATVLTPFKSAVWTLCYRKLQKNMRRRK